MAIGLEILASSIEQFLLTIGPVISIILIVMGGIVYGLAQTQPADMRGKWQTAAISMFIGGVIIAVVTGAANLIQSTSAGALKPV
jgi:cytosine/uracil/thiamine/allantoin permease